MDEKKKLIYQFAKEVSAYQGLKILEISKKYEPIYIELMPILKEALTLMLKQINSKRYFTIPSIVKNMTDAFIKKHMAPYSKDEQKEISEFVECMMKDMLVAKYTRSK